MGEDEFELLIWTICSDCPWNYWLISEIIPSLCWWIRECLKESSRKIEKVLRFSKCDGKCSEKLNGWWKTTQRWKVATCIQILDSYVCRFIALSLYCTFSLETELLNAGFHRLNGWNDDQICLFEFLRGIAFFCRQWSQTDPNHMSWLWDEASDHMSWFSDEGRIAYHGFSITVRSHLISCFSC
jgi:hypothetical protein